ncbi:MAG: hypothetical protein LBS21_08735 [Clostridiales bacterium]|jgi:hypothetical protein|nr:hypothetical protein [Clostridiales bacterium]
MQATKALYDNRKDEIEFYFQILHDVMNRNTNDLEREENRQRSLIQTSDNNRFIRMLKSNYLVMLYNLIESCVKSGFEEIYEALTTKNISYVQASLALRDIWSNYEISKAERNTASEDTYGNRVKSILDTVISNVPIVLSKKSIERLAGGTLDARSIRELLTKHEIAFAETNSGEKHRILTVKNKRNSLAHGEESFGDAARDLTLEDLRNIKNEVLLFIEDAINGMDLYYNNEQYRIIE